MKYFWFFIGLLLFAYFTGWGALFYIVGFMLVMGEMNGTLADEPILPESQPEPQEETPS